MDTEALPKVKNTNHISISWQLQKSIGYKDIHNCIFEIRIQVLIYQM